MLERDAGVGTLYKRQGLAWNPVELASYSDGVPREFHVNPTEFIGVPRKFHGVPRESHASSTGFHASSTPFHVSSTLTPREFHGVPHEFTTHVVSKENSFSQECAFSYKT